MTSPQHQTAVFGVSGYAGAELARLLLHHPRLRGHAPLFFGRPEEEKGARVALTDLHPQLADNNGARNVTVDPFHWGALGKRKIDVVFLATPHEQSRAWVPKLLEHGVRVIDLSGAWRLDEETNRAIYKLEDHDPAAAESIQQGAVYGLPELHREANRKGEAGCQPGMLCDLRHPGAGSACSRKADRPGSWNCMRRKIGSLRSWKNADCKNAFYACGGQFIGVLRL